MVFQKDQCLVLFSSYSTSSILTKLLYKAMYTTVDDANLLYYNKSLKKINMQSMI